MKIARQGLIIWFQHMRNIKQIKKHGHLIYVSRKMKYAVLYVNSEEIHDIEQRLLKYSFISKVDRSEKPFIRTEFENVFPDKAKQYDYKIDI